MAKAAIMLGAAVGAVVLAVLLAKRAGAAPPGEYIPTASEISASQSLTELDTFYDVINELYISHKIDYTKYMELYGAYESRFYELAGVV